MEIIHFVRESNDTFGTQKVAYKLSERFEKSKYKNNIVAFNIINKKSNFICIKNIFRKFHIKNLYIKQLIEIPYFNFMTIVKSFMMTKNKNNIVISHSFDSYFGDVVHMHSLVIHTFIKKIKNKDYKALFYPLYYYLILREFISIHLFKKVIAISSEDKKNILKYYFLKSSQVEVIHNGVDIKQFNVQLSYEEQNKILTSSNINENDFKIIFVGHYFKNKGLYQLIEAINILKHYNIQLLVVGQDNIDNFLKLAKKYGIDDKIKFLGMRSDVNKLMAMSDIFVLPTYNEPFGLVGVEALASGLPILMTKTQGPKDYLKDGINGFFIKRNGDDIAKKISLFYNDKKLLKDMSLQARKDALEFSWDQISKKYISLIEEVYKMKNENI